MKEQSDKDSSENQVDVCEQTKELEKETHDNNVTSPKQTDKDEPAFDRNETDPQSNVRTDESQCSDENTSTLPDEFAELYTGSRGDSEVVDLITRGFVDKFLPGLRKSQATVDQVRSSQAVLLETVEAEIAKFKDCGHVQGVEDTMVKARHYHAKLLRLRKEMTNLHDKSKKLKKRALKLQQQRQTEELTRAHDREHEMEKERMLTARVASPSN